MNGQQGSDSLCHNGKLAASKEIIRRTFFTIKCNKKACLSLCIVMLCVLSFLVFRPFGKKRAAGNDAQIPVTVMRLKLEDIGLKQELPGRVVAFQVAEVRPQVGGIVMERMFTEGGDVVRGQQLYQIDQASYHASYESALASLAKAEANVMSLRAKAERYSKLVKVDAVSKQDFDDVTSQLAQARADVSVAKAAVRVAKINLDYTKMYAPISGRIGKSNVTKGALVTINQQEAVTNITQLDPVYVDLTQSVEDASRTQALRNAVGSGGVDMVLVMDSTGRLYKHHGKLQFTDVTVNKSTGSVFLRAIFPNPNSELLPGAFVRGQLIFKLRGVLVPQKAVTRDSSGAFNIWVVGAKKKVANIKKITVSQAIGNMWLVSDGLSAGDIVVIEGYQRLAPGVRVVTTEVDSSSGRNNAAKSSGTSAHGDVRYIHQNVNHSDGQGSNVVNNGK